MTSAAETSSAANLTDFDSNVNHPSDSATQSVTQDSQAFTDAMAHDHDSSDGVISNSPVFGFDELIDSNATSFSDFFWDTPPNTTDLGALSDSDSSISFSDGFINPSMRTSNVPYASVSPWSTPQSVRTNNVTIESVKPTHPMDGTPDRLVRRLNDLFREVVESGKMTDAQVLGTTTTYLDAFKHGRSF